MQHIHVFAMAGSRFFRLTLLKSASFLSPETLAGDFLYQERKMSVNNNNKKQLKLEPIDISKEPEPEDGQSPQKSLANLHAIKNQHHPGAPSLLSSKSHKQGSYSTGFPTMSPPSPRENQDVCIRIHQKSTTKNIARKRRILSGMGNKEENLMVHDSRSAHVWSVQRDGFLQTSEHDNYLSYISPEVESTVNLFQLSSHLQRVEQLRRNSVL